MSCMADVHEVQEASDKSKFHRQIMGVVLCMITESVILILFPVLFLVILSWLPLFRPTCCKIKLTQNHNKLRSVRSRLRIPSAD